MKAFVTMLLVFCVLFLPAIARSTCLERPCQNGGTCNHFRIFSWCTCADGYYGNHCETHACELNPCRHGGICHIEKNGYNCTCPSFVEGRHCEKIKCKPNPCKNGATCTESECICPKNCHGFLCEKTLNCKKNEIYQHDALKCQPTCLDPNPTCIEIGEACVCKSGFLLSNGVCVPKHHCGCKHGNLYIELHGVIVTADCCQKIMCVSPGRLKITQLTPCQKDSVCIIKHGKYQCVCKKGFVLKGKLCVPKAHCEETSCRNGGKCLENGNSFRCECLYFLQGYFCQFFKCRKNPCKNNGICTIFGCMCKQQYYGILCESEKQCDCRAYGNHHYKTFDGQMIDFIGNCKYTMAESIAGESFSVEVKNGLQDGSRSNLVETKIVDVKLANITIRLSKGHTMLVDGILTTIPVKDYLGFSADYSGRSIEITTQWGLKVVSDGQNTLTVSVPKRFQSRLTGICGNCNGVKDDLRTKEGTDISGMPNKFSLIVKSYEVPDCDNPKSKCNVSDLKMTCSDSQVSICNNMNNEVFNKCKKVIGKDEYERFISSCKLDTCSHVNSNLFHGVFCQSIESLVSACEDYGVSINWRSLFNCPLDCPSYEVYVYDALKYQPSCSDPIPRCTEVGESCVCRWGFFQSGQYCVPHEACGCMYKGRYMNMYQIILTDDCSKQIICTSPNKLKITPLGPCKKNSECKSKHGVYQCVCKEGFILEGKSCVRKNKCALSPCRNGGLCFPQKIGYSCICPYRFEGRNCEILKCKQNPCQNEGTCREDGCICKTSYFGVFCEKEKCEVTSCRNGGKCLANGNSFRCKCLYFLQGRDCQFFKCRKNPCKNNGICTLFGCMCKQHYYGILCEREKQCDCRAFGNHHYKTFDGQMIDFIGNCKYTMAESIAGEYFSVEVKNGLQDGSRSDLVETKIVDVKLANVTIRLSKGHMMLVNGILTTIPVKNVMGISADYSGRSIEVTTTWGLKVVFDGRNTLTVSVPTHFQGKVTGICGNCNGVKDDLRTKDGTDVSRMPNKFSLIVKSYEVPDDSDRPQSKCNVSDLKMTCSDSQVSICNNMNNEIFNKCKKVIGKDEYERFISSCKLDTCSHVNSNLFHGVFCQSIESLVSACEDYGVSIHWRSLSNCSLDCPSYEVYVYDALKYQPSCSDPIPRCTEIGGSCVCRWGFFRSGQYCVPHEACGCMYKGRYMNVYQIILSDDCSKHIICTSPNKLKITTLGPCKENSECKTKNEVYQCVCKEGFILEGTSCVPKNKCALSPCRNGGLCFPQKIGYSCTCPYLFKGKKCEILKCKPNPCHNKGKCREDGCICNKPYCGVLCEKVKCKPNPCQNKGKCSKYGCACKEPYHGSFCEKGCEIRGDFLIAIDASNGITKLNFNTLINIVIKVVKIFDIAKGKARVGVIAFAKTVFFKIGLGTYTNKLDLISSLNLLRYCKLDDTTPKNTNLPDALANLTSMFAESDNSSGYCVPTYAIVLSYSKSIDYQKTKTNSKLLRLGTTVFSIGIGNNINVKEMLSIASRPHYKFFFRVNFGNIYDIIKILSYQICGDLKRLQSCFKCRFGCHCLPVCRKCLRLTCCNESSECEKRNEICWKGYCNTKIRK